MRNCVAPFIVKMRYVSIVVFTIILAFSVWGGTQIQTPNHPPEIFPRDSNIQHFINLSYDFTSTERCDKCSGYFADRSSLLDRAKKLPSYHANDQKHFPNGGGLDPSVLNGGGSNGGRGNSGQSGTGAYSSDSGKDFLSSPPQVQPNENNEYVIPINVHQKDPGIVDLCEDNVCSLTHAREDSASTAEVILVFGIKGVDMAHLKNHVSSLDEGIPIFDENFRINKNVFDAFCRICRNTLARKDLIKDISGQQDCAAVCDSNKMLMVSRVRSWVPKYLGYHTDKNITIVDWIALPFRSTTPNGVSNCKAYHHWAKWQEFVDQQKEDPAFPPELASLFQTSDRWSHVFTEIVLVDGAIRGIAISLWFCIMATIIFTGHPVQTLIVMSTIVCEIGFVFGCFSFVGLELGAVEAISLAILVGTSVDYCVHLVEGYRIAGKTAPPDTWDGSIRGWRLRHALNHIGVPIVSSAITTVLAACTLSLTQIQMFSRFGKILALTMTLSLVYTLFMAGSLLAVFAPAKFAGSKKSSLKGLVIAIVLTCAVIPLPLYLFKEAIIC